jgi:hypothetical protein
MKGGRLPHGYTVVEVMIFLAVSTALLVVAILAFQGQQGRTDFATSAREMESRLQDYVNDVSTGFYARPADFGCVGTAGGPVFTGSSEEQGTNEDCIFIGRVAQFDLSGSGGNQYNVYTVAGLRTSGSGIAKREARGFTDAQPEAVVSPRDMTQYENYPSGLRFGTMYYQQGAAITPIDAVGFFSSFSQYSGTALEPGSISVNVQPLIGAGAGSASQSALLSEISALTDASATAQNPNGGVVICMNSNNSNQYAKFTIGGFDRRLSTNLEIKNGSCPANLALT